MTAESAANPEGQVDYTVVFRTKDTGRFGGGTGRTVMLAAKESDEFAPFTCKALSQEHKFAPFKRGSTDTFTFMGKSMDPKFLKLKRQGTAMELNGWYVEDVVITNTSTGMESYFPVFRPLALDGVHLLRTMDTLNAKDLDRLKQLSALPADRKAQADTITPMPLATPSEKGSSAPPSPA
eukprot:CAMPEP_0182866166 /NCGR_PEP_ID=MMETSP0034_2-20130328/8069_1 /TAXON_ID=156128 /ORGANISM="Nephroselmis pyriformis, Strain CCMP717" /LENGTH=179 /DNA_ID=CAMNT_0024998493 /DNA_START=81 /DNA_END=617 /DNA_ORIENTATION=+